MTSRNYWPTHEQPRTPEHLPLCSNASPVSWQKKITEQIAIPTIGIGAGAHCDGQVLVLHDLLGITSGYMPRFVKAYADLKTEITRAVTQYRDEVRSGAFPSNEHAYE